MTINASKAYAASSIQLGYWLGEDLWEIFLPDRPKPPREQDEGPIEYKDRLDDIVRQAVREYVAAQYEISERMGRIITTRKDRRP